MDKIFKVVLLLALVISTYSCDKIEQPYIIITDLDTSLFDQGNFIDYIAPEFDENTNTLRNVLVEDFTGHQCAFCPPAAERAKAIEAANPGRAFSVAIHASPSASGTGSFQEIRTTGNKFRRDFTVPEGMEIASHLFGVHGGNVGNPTGTISRLKKTTGEIFLSHPEWTDMANTALNKELVLNIQAKSSYFPGTGGVFIHTQVEFVEATSGEFALVIYAIDNEIIDWQKDVVSGDIENYKHHNVHIGNVFDGETFGRVFINGPVEVGDKFEKDFSYVLPEGLAREDMHFLIFVVDKGTEEVLQVIKHEI